MAVSGSFSDLRLGGRTWGRRAEVSRESGLPRAGVGLEHSTFAPNICSQHLNTLPTFDAPEPGEPLIIIWPTAHDPLDAAIKFLTHGKGTHAAFRRASGNIIESFWPRVRERGWRQGERRKVELYRIDGTGPAEWSALERWFDCELQFPAPYSIRDLFRYALGKPPLRGRSCFCSQWVLRGLSSCLAPEKMPLTRLEWPCWASPRDLRISPRLIAQRK